MADRGLVIGHFNPLHVGHEFFVRTVAGLSEGVTIGLLAGDDQSIELKVREHWLQETFPDHQIVTLDQPLDLLGRVNLAEFAAHYNHDPSMRELAASLNLPLRVIDPAREAVRVSGGDIRADLAGYWQYLSEASRVHLAKRVCLFGPESTGKTTLTRELAERYQTSMMPEFGRIHDEVYQPTEWRADMMVSLAQTHQAMQRALMPRVNRLLFEDTDALATVLWSQAFVGEVSDWFEGHVELADLYLLMDIDVPWVADDLRVLGDEAARKRFFDAARQLLDERGANYVVVSGSWDERRTKAVGAVDQLLHAAGLSSSS